MEKKEEKKDSVPAAKTDDVNGEKNEKIVYKVVHVPYYYPVPVDIEWYHKQQDQMTHPHENGFPFIPPDQQRYFEQVVPPSPHGFPPFSAMRRDYRDYRDFRESRRHRYEMEPDYSRFIGRSRSISPSSHTQISPREGDSPRNGELPKKTSSSRGNSPSAITPVGDNTVNDEQKSIAEKAPEKLTENLNENLNEKLNEKEDDQSDDGENGIDIMAEIKKEVDDSKNGSDSNEDVQNDEDKNIEVNRRRKRPLMTFPYDQRKKLMLAEQQSENTKKHMKDENDEKVTETRARPESDDDERKYRKHVMIPADHPQMMSSHVPYVMVPVRSPGYMASDMRYESRHSSDKDYRYERAMYERNGRHEGREYKSFERSERKPDDQKLQQHLRFHPNGRRARTVFTRQQLLTLNNVFEKHPFVSGERMSELSDQLGLDRKIVKIWFQNKRQYARKKGNLLDREEDYYYEYSNTGSNDSYGTNNGAPPTMAERWK